MNPVRIAFVLLFVAFVFIGRSVAITGHAVEVRPLDSALRTTSVSLPLLDIQRDTTDSTPAQDPGEPKTDLFGNQIDDAVGDYRVDVKGEIYEWHSPDTEVSRLAPPIG